MGNAPRPRCRSICAQLSFFFNAHNDFFEESPVPLGPPHLAQAMVERYKSKNPRSWGAALSYADRRLLLDGAAALQQRRSHRDSSPRRVLGGTQSLHTIPSMSLGTATEFAATIALRTQQIIAHETGVTNTVDPLGGSYFVETLTTKSSMERGNTSRESTPWAAWSRPSSAVIPTRNRGSSYATRWL